MTERIPQKSRIKPQRTMELVAASADPGTLHASAPINLEWGILVNRHQEEIVRRAEAQSKISPSTVISWFPDKWRPEDGPVLSDFVKAIRFASVTQHYADENLHLAHGKRSSTSSAQKIASATNLLAAALSPETIDRILAMSFYTQEQINNLVLLGGAALNARDIIKSAKPRPRFVAWHDTAHMAYHYVRKLLKEAGHAQPGYNESSPAVLIICEALKAMGENDQLLGTISKALRNSVKDDVNVTRLYIESKYRHKIFVT